MASCSELTDLRRARALLGTGCAGPTGATGATGATGPQGLTGAFVLI